MESDVRVSQDNLVGAVEHIIAGTYPQLFLTYRCTHVYAHENGDKNDCPGEARLDAYKGPPRCYGVFGNPHTPKWMVPDLPVKE